MQFVGNWNHIFHLTFQNEKLWGKRSNKAVTIWSSIIISVVEVVPLLKRVIPKVYQGCVIRNFTSLLLFQATRTAETSIVRLEIWKLYWWIKGIGWSILKKKKKEASVYNWETQNNIYLIYLFILEYQCYNKFNNLCFLS